MAGEVEQLDIVIWSGCYPLSSVALHQEETVVPLEPRRVVEEIDEALLRFAVQGSLHSHRTRDCPCHPIVGSALRQGLRPLPLQRPPLGHQRQIQVREGGAQR